MKKKKYSQIKKEERDEISILLDKGFGVRDIASALGRNPGTISRELQRNQKRNGSYEPKTAHHKAYVRRKYAKYQGKKINEDNDLREYLLEGLRRYWSPDGISGRMRYEGQSFYVSKTAIYEWLYGQWGQFHCQYLYSQRYRPKKRKKKNTKKTLIPNRKGLELRPEEANERLVPGHYEGDTMVSGRKTGSKAALSVIYDRFSRQIEAEKISALRPHLFNKAIIKIRERTEGTIKSFTLDNGIENSRYEELEIPTYFCDPYSSWQKGGVENAIRMLRWFIPKGTDIAQYSDDYVKMAVGILNNKPRKSLGYRTPLEAMTENTSTNFNYQNLEIKQPEGVALRG